MKKLLYIFVISCFTWSVFDKSTAYAGSTPQHTLTIITSPSCPACEKFYKNKFPEIQKFAGAHNILIQYFSFAADKRTVAAIALTHSLSPDRQHELYVGFLNTHEKWHVEGEQGLLELKKTAESMGIPDATIEKILYDEDEPIKEKVFQSILEMSQQHKITYVPCILIDNQFVVEADLDAVKEKLQEMTTRSSN